MSTPEDSTAAHEDPTKAGSAAEALEIPLDPRLMLRERGVKGYWDVFVRRMKAGELGSIPVVVGLIVISHNLADVFEVADRIVVLRLGRNAGVFDAHTDSSEDVVAAITGASDSAALERERARIGKAHAEKEASS